MLNVLIPMAGLGSRFATAGYVDPKPLIDVIGAPMIQRVVENLGFSSHARYIFIVQREHYEKYNLEVVLGEVAPGCSVVQIDGLTEGAAVTSLFAADLIDCDVPLVIANSDQVVLGGWNGTRFIRDASLTGQDGSIVCFKAEDRNPKWSYANVGYGNKVWEVAEKRAISDWATVGIYWWRKGSDYVKYAKQMIDRGVRTNGEFYIAPVFNEALEDGLDVRSYVVDEMWGIGTPEDLEKYLAKDCA
jgi:dTDP-glucose pyrophosphorylase